jgi:Tfp pilus assembly protein PilF
LKHHHLITLLLAILPYSLPAATPTKEAPPEFAEYFAAIRKADAITDPLRRCLAYPDLPNNTWAAGLAQARCNAFLTPPRYTLDAIESLLTQTNGPATLETNFKTLLHADDTDPAQREHINSALSVFSDANRDKAERIARKWQAADPQSAFAHAALGLVLENRGWSARGSAFIKDTPDDNIKKMSAYFQAAAKEYSAALEASPKLILACEGLMEIGRQSSDKLQSYATAKCLKAAPTSYFVIDEMMTAAEPRWGGSDAAMRAVAAYAKARVADNPLLGLFAFQHAFYEIEHMDAPEQDQQALAVLEPAALQAPIASYLRLVGGAYLRKDEPWKALSYLSQALRFSPNYAQESRLRALALQDVGETQWARADAERAVALDPTNGHALEVLGQILRKLDGPAAAAPYFKRAIEDKNTREYAYNNYCAVLIDSKQLDAANKCIDSLLSEFPQNPEGWRQRLYVIGFDATESNEAMARFIALNDPKRWSYHADAVKGVQLVQAVLHGTGTVEERSNARALRAKALEHSLNGHAYFQGLTTSPANYLTQIINSCQTIPAPTAAPEFAILTDVNADGTLSNVEVRPVNSWTTCLAKQAAINWKLPPPPKLASGLPYPLLYEVRMEKP